MNYPHAFATRWQIYDRIAAQANRALANHHLHDPIYYADVDSELADDIWSSFADTPDTLDTFSTNPCAFSVADIVH